MPFPLVIHSKKGQQSTTSQEYNYKQIWKQSFIISWIVMSDEENVMENVEQHADEAR